MPEKTAPALMLRKNTKNFKYMEEKARNARDYWHHMMAKRNSIKCRLLERAVTILSFIVVFFIILMLFGCTTVKYVPVETVKTEYVTSVDTLIERDTISTEKEVIVREAFSSDSALLAKVGLQLDESKKYILVLKRELERQSHEKAESKTDTVIQIKEVQVPYKVEVEKRLSLWQKIKIKFGGIAFSVCLFFIVLLLVGFVLTRRRS